MDWCWGLMDRDGGIRPEVERLIQSAEDDTYRITATIIHKPPPECGMADHKFLSITATHPVYRQIQLGFHYDRIVSSRDGWGIRVVGATGLLPMTPWEESELISAFLHQLTPSILSFHTGIPKEDSAALTMREAINALLPTRKTPEPNIK